MAVLLAALIGSLGAFFGIGGGLLTVPLLSGMLGLAHRVAVGTSIGLVLAVSLASVLLDVVLAGPQEHPAWLACAFLAPGAIAGAVLATPWVKTLPLRVLRRAFAAVMLLAAIKMLGLPPFQVGSGIDVFVYRDATWPALLVLPVLGLLTGILATLVGIGGGIVLVPVLGLLFADLRPVECRATSLVVVVATALAGLLRHARQGTADLSWVARLGPGSVIGAAAGTWLAHRVSGGLFERLFGALLVYVALDLLLRKPAAERSVPPGDAP